MILNDYRIWSNLIYMVDVKHIIPFLFIEISSCENTCSVIWNLGFEIVPKYVLTMQIRHVITFERHIRNSKLGYQMKRKLCCSNHLK